MIEVTLKINLSRYLTGKYLDLHKLGVYEFDEYYESTLKENLVQLIKQSLQDDSMQDLITGTYAEVRDEMSYMLEQI